MLERRRVRSWEGMVLFFFSCLVFLEEEDERIFEVLLLLLIGMEDGIVWERGIRRVSPA